MSQELPKILYLDDEIENLSSFKALFRPYYEIYTCDEVEEARAILKEEEIHIVVADQKMPDISGVEFLEEVARQYPLLPRILLTGYSDVDAIIQSINRGEVYRYITKPYIANDFKLTLDSAFELYSLKKKNQLLLIELEEKNRTLEMKLEMQKRTEAELRLSQARLMITIESTGQGIWDWNRKYNRVNLSENWLKFLEYSEMEIQPLHNQWKKFVDSEDIKKLKKEFFVHFRNKTSRFEVEFRLRKKGGDLIWVYAAGKVIEEHRGKPLHIVGHFMDITQKKEAESKLLALNEVLEARVMERTRALAIKQEELRTVNNKLLLHIENTPLAYIEIDEYGLVKAWNPSAERIFGYKKEEVLGKDIFYFFKQVPELRNYPQDDLLIYNDKDSINTTSVSLRKDGKKIICDWYSTTLFNDKKNIIGVASLVHDVTERLLAEKETVETNLALKKAKEEAEKANKAKSEFLANMSHEIRTPLNAIIGFTDLLEDLVKETTQKHYLNSIKTSGKALLALINDILDLSKIEAGKLVLSYEMVNPYSIFEEIKNIFFHAITRKKIDFLLSIEPEMPGLMLDEIRLRQVLINLVGNAVKFTSEGFIKLEVKYKPIYDMEGYIELFISIQDTGIGISFEEQKLIFDEFRQSQKTLNQHGGTGLGLTISNRLVKTMGGEIILSSKENEGSIFTIHLPRVRIGEVWQKEEEKSNEFINYKFKGSKILLVDDIESNRNLIIGYLKPENLKLYQAKNGIEAIQQFHKHNPDLILMDIRMPLMDGNEAARKIRMHSKDVCLIALTASILNEEENELFNKYLRKPIRRTELLSELFSFLPHHIEEETKAETLENPDERDNKETWRELLLILEKIFETEFSGLKERMIFDELIKFADKIQYFSEIHHWQRLKIYAERVKFEAELFDIKALEKSLESFYEYIEYLKKQLL